MKKIATSILMLSLLLNGCHTTQSVRTETQEKNETAEGMVLEKMKESFMVKNYKSVIILFDATIGRLGTSSPLYDEAKKLYEDALELENIDRRNKPPLERLTTNFDDFENITWHKQSYFIHGNNINLFSLYIGQKEEAKWLRLKVNYYGDDWIFFEKCYLSYDGNTYDVTFDQYRDKKSDNDTKVWEWIDISVDDNLLAYLSEYAYSETPKIRLGSLSECVGRGRNRKLS